MVEPFTGRSHYAGKGMEGVERSKGAKTCKAEMSEVYPDKGERLFIEDAKR